MRKTIADKIMGIGLIFGSGFVTAMNLAHLIGMNPDYDAGWGKIALCGVLALFGGYMVIWSKNP